MATVGSFQAKVLVDIGMGDPREIATLSIPLGMSIDADAGSGSVSVAFANWRDQLADALVAGAERIRNS